MMNRTGSNWRRHGEYPPGYGSTVENLLRFGIIGDCSIEIKTSKCVESCFHILS
jgi:hypothetical protein